MVKVTGLYHLFFLLVFCQLLRAQDWPQWRGAKRDGVAAGTASKAWPERLTQKWQTTVGVGHSSPVVAGNRIYLFTRQGEDEVVRCLELETGKEIWSDRYAVPYQMNRAATGHGKGPKSTPVISNGKLY